MASLNLPAALEDTSGTEIPQSLLEKALYVRNAGGIQALEVAMKELPDLLQRNKELLDEVKIYIYIFSYVFFKVFFKFHIFYIHYSARGCYKRNVNLTIN